METNESDNLNRNELFEELKGKCKSIAQRDLYGGLFAMVLVILLLIFSGDRLDNPKNLLYFIFWIVIACLGGWLMLIDYRYLKKNGDLDTPDRLLYWFEKRHRYNLIGWIAICILLIGSLLVEPGADFYGYVGVAFGIAIVVIIFFCCGGPWWYLKEKDIIEQLRELVDKK